MLKVTPGRVWVGVSLLVLCVSLASGYRASRAAGMPLYLFTKTRVPVEEPYVPETAEAAEAEAAFREAGGEPTMVPVLRPMWVLGLVDGALPVVLLTGVGCWVSGRVRRKRCAAMKQF